MILGLKPCEMPTLDKYGIDPFRNSNSNIPVYGEESKVL